MYKLVEPFGYHISGETLGEAWLDLVTAIVKEGETAFDEGRERLCLQNVRVRINRPVLPDALLDKYADAKKIADIVHLTFQGEVMYDCDIKPSFSPGAKSYYARIKEGQMDTYIVERLAEIPESKKAVISFIHWDDYKAVLANPRDDYLPCIVSVQFRLIEQGDGYEMTVNFNARSIDAFQKSNGNMVAIYLLASKICDQLTKRLQKPVMVKVMDGFITDAHIYKECYADAQQLIANGERGDN